MEKKQKNKWLSFLADGMLSGLMIGIGCVVSMSCENRYLGAFLFSLGLFCIVQFQPDRRHRAPDTVRNGNQGKRHGRDTDGSCTGNHVRQVGRQLA